MGSGWDFLDLESIVASRTVYLLPREVICIFAPFGAINAFTVEVKTRANVKIEFMVLRRGKLCCGLSEHPAADVTVSTSKTTANVSGQSFDSRVTILIKKR